ncbi:hypothetical protein B0A48_07484 [Cryoendolithus antarcticus]|uniref:Uncharacterized protein n=1 Tax=Cryoendolithus antarcticus TaxID=1507870 RepID=A0A1V8T6Q4_9PEZI|nr:hypothetical protein B0A48_07484 [Cryoendolithus antarcticus]
MPSRTSSNASTSSTRSIKSTTSTSSVSTRSTQTTNTTASSSTVNPGAAPHVHQGPMPHANHVPVLHGNNTANNAWPFALPAEDPLAQVGSWNAPPDQHYLNEVAARSQQILQRPGNNRNGRQTVSWAHLVAVDPLAAELESLLLSGMCSSMKPR